MTAGGDFMPGDSQDFEGGSSYPEVFGLKLTPTVLGIVCLVAGIGASIYIYTKLVQPVLTENAQLQQDIQTKESLLVDQGVVQQQIDEARAKLKDAEALKADVLALFASEDSLDTLLLDLNERVQSVNSGVSDPNRRANLAKFELDPELSGVIADGSFGSAVDNRLQRQVFNVEMQGDFAQTQSIMRNIERLQPLIVVRDFKSELDLAAQSFEVDAQGRIVNREDVTQIDTSFQLNVLLPAPEGTYEAANPAPAAPANGQGQPPGNNPNAPGNQPPTN
jgi:type IV pilus assembly protein PilO